MAEYILKLDIDSNELARKLKKVLGGINMGGGGMATVFGGGGGMTGSQSQKMFEEMVKNLEKQTEMLQKKLDKADTTRKSGFLGKFGPGLVKIAGFSVGMAGLLQFRKMLIDSSPMLQAVLKIMSTAFNLILRPFGDFLGFFLLPLTMGLLQFAVPFYAMAIKLAPDFYRAGTKFFSGDILGALKIVTNAINILKEKLGFITEFSLGDIFGGVGLLSPLFEWIGDQVQKWFGEQLENSALALRVVWQMFLQNLENGWGALVTFFGGMSEQIEGGIRFAWDNFLIFFHGLSGAVRTVLGDAWDTLVTWFEGVQQQVGTLRFAMDSLVGWFVTVFNSVTTTLKTTWDGIVKFFIDIFNRLKSIFNTITLGVFSGGGGGGGGKTPGGSSPHISTEVTKWKGSNGKLYDSEAEANANSPPATKVTVKLQKGGLINEPIIGTGLRTGKSYAFGEAGPEAIVPLNKVNEIGGGGSLTINVYGLYNITDFEAKIRPMVMRWMKESKSNRGIL